ncbi:MAG: hypothetical protein PHD29_02900 [bacterium]|nr:hypothetical protein [bacterium]MDD5354426.1 hypothetical protein [bacterium]MDD5755940.1 hypothetical protein [bacterium]
MKKFLCAILLGSLLFSACATGRPNINSANKNKREKEVTEVVQAEGLAAIFDNDLLDAKKRALGEAQRNAVEMTVGVYVNAATRVEKALMVDQQILSKTNGYIKKYKILSSGREGDLYKTKIEALVKIEAVNKDLNLLGLTAPPMPTTSNLRIGVVIMDHIDGVPEPERISALVLSNKLLALQYKIVELDEIAAKADVMITGNSMSSFNTDQVPGGLVSYRATISFKVVKTGQADLIYSNSFSSGGVSSTRKAASREALKRAAEIAAEDLTRVLDQRLKLFNFIAVSVQNVASLNQLDAVIKGLRNMIEVRSAQTESFSQGIADIKIGAEIKNLPAIAQKLETKVEGIKVKVTAVTNSSITAEIQ